MTQKRWTISIITLLVVSVLAIGGIIFYGTVVAPQQRSAADKAACDTFAQGVLKAREAVISMTQTKPPASDADAAQKYLDTIDKGIDDAFNLSTKNSDVYNALAQIGMSRINYDATQGFAAITNLENGFGPIQTACSAVEPTPTATNG